MERVAPPTRWHGAVLAGGASRRFGRDKVLEAVAGRRFVDLAAASLADALSLVVVLGAAERAAALAPLLPAGALALSDDTPGRGPLGGLATALARYSDAWVAVLAADLPLVPRAWWPALAARHRDGARALVPRDADGRWQPLAALYHGSLGGRIAHALERGERRPQRLCDALADDGLVVAVPVADVPAGALLNVNTPADVAAVAARLREGEA